jgi:flagellar basal body P-ring formation protein FlgA
MRGWADHRSPKPAASGKISPVTRHARAVPAMPCRTQNLAAVSAPIPARGTLLAKLSAMTSLRTTCNRRACVAAVLWVASHDAPAATTVWQELDAIRTVAASAAAARQAEMPGKLQAEAALLDARLRLPACDAPLEAAAPDGSQTSGRVTVAVRCPGSTPWRVHVPVKLTVTQAVVVAAIPLERGRILAPGDVILAERELNATPSGYLTDPLAAVGRLVRRSLPAGAVVGPAGLEAPVLIRRGQAVSVEARRGLVAVSMAGIAQSDGALGELIPVRNVQSKRILQGIVRNEKSVEIRLP